MFFVSSTEYRGKETFSSSIRIVLTKNSTFKQTSSMPSSERVKIRERSRRSRSPTKPPLATAIPRRGRRSSGSVGIVNSKENPVEYESPTESMSTSSRSPTESTSTSSLSSYPVERNMCTPEKDRSNDDSKIVRIDVTETEKIPEPATPENGAMIEVAKITALVEEELQCQRLKHRDQLNRTVTKYKGRLENFQIELDKIRSERDETMRELEECKRNLASQKLEAERNDRFQSEQEDEIEMLEGQHALNAELQKERDTLLAEVTKAQLRQKKTKDELSALKVRVREDSQKRLSVMECLSASWDAEKKEAKQKEALLNSELEIMSKTLKAEQEYLKHKNKEFNQLESHYRSIKAELRAMKKSVGGRKDGMEDELRRERESRKRLSEEHKKTLKLKNQEIRMAENTIKSMKEELKSARESFILKEESMTRSIEGMKQYNENMSMDLQTEGPNPEVQMLQEENIRMEGEIKELHKQVESYLANMALQQEFCDSLKSRIYKEQESEHEQIEELHRVRKQLKRQQRESAEKDKRIDELKQLLRESTSSPKSKSLSTSSRNVMGEKKSKTRKSKSLHNRRNSGGYRTS